MGRRSSAVARVDLEALPAGGDAVEADPRRGSVADQVAWMEREQLLPGQHSSKADKRKRLQWRARYREFRAKGWCPGCGQDAVPGRSTCAECAQRIREHARERSNRLIAQGVCRDCAGVVEPGRKRCARCLARLRSAAARRYARFTRLRLCRWCGKRSHGLTGALCDQCRGSRQARRRLLDAVYTEVRASAKAGIEWAQEVLQVAEQRVSAAGRPRASSAVPAGNSSTVPVSPCQVRPRSRPSSHPGVGI